MLKFISGCFGEHCDDLGLQSHFKVLKKVGYGVGEWYFQESSSFINSIGRVTSLGCETHGTLCWWLANRHLTKFELLMLGIFFFKFWYSTVLGYLQLQLLTADRLSIR